MHDVWELLVLSSNSSDCADQVCVHVLVAYAVCVHVPVGLGIFPTTAQSVHACIGSHVGDSVTLDWSHLPPARQF